MDEHFLKSQRQRHVTLGYYILSHWTFAYINTQYTVARCDAAICL